MKQREEKGITVLHIVLGVLILAVVLLFLRRQVALGNAEVRSEAEEETSTAAESDILPYAAQQKDLGRKYVLETSYHITNASDTAAEGMETTNASDTAVEEIETTNASDAIAEEMETAGTEEASAVTEEETEASIDAESGASEGAEAEAAESLSDGNYILPESNSRYYTKEELSGLTDHELYLARNEIYARLGRKFNSEELQNYFAGKAWYHPQYEPASFDAQGDSIFNPYELVNRDLLSEIEKERKG